MLILILYSSHFLSFLDGVGTTKGPETFSIMRRSSSKRRQRNQRSAQSAQVNELDESALERQVLDVMLLDDDGNNGGGGESASSKKEASANTDNSSGCNPIPPTGQICENASFRLAE